MKDEMVCLEPFDWRYSAAIVGLRKYLEWLGVDEEPNLIITEDCTKSISDVSNDL